MMRIYAKNIIKKTYYMRVKDPLAGGAQRISKLADLEVYAINFVENVLLDLELPSSPVVHLGALKGFEDINLDIEKVSGIITLYASFNTLSGYKIRMEVPVSVFKGYFQRPSIVVVNNKKHVLSQSLIDRLIARYETTRPKFMDLPNPSAKVVHLDNIVTSMFGMPSVTGDWYDMVVDRYSL